MTTRPVFVIVGLVGILGMPPLHAEEGLPEGGATPEMTSEMVLEQLTERDKHTRRIQEQFAAGQMSFEEARRQLWPYAKEDMASLIEHLDDEIARTEAKLRFLKQADRDASVLIELRVKELLGAISPEEHPLW